MALTVERFPQELQGKSIEVIEHRCENNLSKSNVKTCILGVLLSDEGKRIEQYMLLWLKKEYNVISVRQPMPGNMFEFPALRFAQLFSVENKEPVLYLHTKGAGNPGKIQRKIVNMWKHEYVVHKSAYDKSINQYDLLVPYSGPQAITLFNGFIASPKAFSSIPSLVLVDDRYFYEKIFEGKAINLFCRRLSNVCNDGTKDTRFLLFRDLKRFPSSFTSFSEFLHIIYKLIFGVTDFCRGRSCLFR